MTTSRQTLDTGEWASNVEFVRRLARSLVAGGAASARGDDSDDLAQDAWVAWLRESKRARDPVSPRGWLASVLHNLVRMRLRASERRGRRELEVARTQAGSGSAVTPATVELVAQIDLHRRVVERVLALAEPYRSVIVLRFHEQRSLAQVAKELGVPVETVKTRQKRGLEQLRRELVGVGEDAERGDRLGALVLLARGGGGVAMTIGAKWGISGAAAAVVALAFVTWRVVERSSSDIERPVVAARTPESAPADVQPARTEEAPTTKDPVESDHSVSSLQAESTSERQYDVRGDVVDARGGPMRGVRVELFELDGSTGFATALRDGESDDQGAFAFEGAPFRRRSAGVVFAWDGPACAGAEFVPGDSLPLHLVLGETKSLTGRVVDTMERPIEGAALIAALRSAGNDRQLHIPRGAREKLTVRSAADGSFELSGLPRGWRVIVDVQGDGYASRRESIELDETSTTATQNFVLLPEATVEGRVTMPDGAAASGFRVGAQRHFNQPGSSRNSWGEAVTGEDGRYVIRGIETGSWNVFVSLDERQKREWCVLPHGDVELTDTVPRATADFVLQRGGELVVYILDAKTGAPVADQWIGIQSSSKPGSGAAVDVAYSDDDGVARIRLPPGPVSPYVGEMGGRWTRAGEELARGSRAQRADDKSLELLSEETLELTLEIERGITLRGVVVDPQGQPVKDAVVWFVGGGTRMDNSPSARSRPDGTFELTGIPARRDWRLRAASIELAMSEFVVIDAVSGDADKVKLWLEPRPDNVVTGRVVDSAGKPVTGATVMVAERTADGRSLELDSPDPANSTRTPSDGTFELRGLWPGKDYWLNATRLVESAEGVVIDTANVEFGAPADGETRRVGDLVLRPQGK